MKKILLIDDSDTYTWCLQKYLQHRGYPVKTASTLKEARAAIQEEMPLVVCCDLDLPDGSGMDFLDEVRAADKELPFILASCHDREDYEQEAMRRGATLCMDKMKGLLLQDKLVEYAYRQLSGEKAPTFHKLLFVHAEDTNAGVLRAAMLQKGFDLILVSSIGKAKRRIFEDALGLSMALGTFIAGVLLAESEYRHELETAIDPFKGLLLGLFFISVGMSLNLGVLYTHLLWVAVSVVVLVAVKTLVLYLLARLYGIRSSERMQFAGVLSQGGEFAFVLFSTASSQRLFQGDQMSLLLVTVTLSMMTTPLLMKLVDKWLSRQLNGPEEEDEKPWVDDDKPQVIVVGFGRFGQVIGRLLMANKMCITVLERDISAVNLMRKYGYKVYYGDATQVELLRSAGAEAAESIVITCNEPEDTMKLVEICRQHFPHLHILARARGRVEAHELLQAGVTQFSRETFSSALELGRKTLVSLGMHPHQAQRAQLHFRRLDMRMLRELIPMHTDMVQISRAREARRELEEIFQREMQQERRQLDGWDEFE